MNKNARLCRFALQRTIITALLVILTISLASCGSDEPQWADPEVHEKMEQLREQYTPFIVGTWHYEKVGDKQRVFELLTFNADGTLSGLRKWQARQVVTIDGQEQYTDWENLSQPNGHFRGTWSLIWERNEKDVGENRLFLYGEYDETDIITYLPYSTRALFGYADSTTLRFAGLWQDSDGWTSYERGEAIPSF
ncbi:MAG: hypothetical protein II538_03325 [Bacteroidaceae bacterium]|nr:hypothetical protein [Bacteroidaceae bacterium]